jgi:hypothetical protein
VADISNACHTPETAVRRGNQRAQQQKQLPTKNLNPYDLMLQSDKYSNKGYE